MIERLNHIAIIVSCEEALDFYKKIGFYEISRKYNEYKKQTLVFMKSEIGIILEVFIKDVDIHQNEPELSGLRHLAFDVDDMDLLLENLKDYQIQKEIKIDDKRIIFIYDYDKQAVEFIEKGALEIK